MTTDTMRMPPIAAIRARLYDLNLAAVAGLAERSGVSYFTLMKIRNGDTTDPGIETVRKFLGHLPKRART